MYPFEVSTLMMGSDMYTPNFHCIQDIENFHHSRKFPHVSLQSIPPHPVAPIPGRMYTNLNPIKPLDLTFTENTGDRGTQ